MVIVDCESTAAALVADGKGILAADETPGTLTRRFDALKIPSTPDTRRSYREMLFTTPGIAQFISGVIMQDETIRQRSSIGTLFADLLAQQNVIPGIKIDTGAKHLAGTTAEKITEGLDGLRDRLKDYAQMGARFAKWRAVIRIGDGLPTSRCVQANTHVLARYAALCQEQGLVPIIEPEVLMDGSHAIERCEEVTCNILQATFNALFEQRVALEEMLLKPNMIISAKEFHLANAGTDGIRVCRHVCSHQASVDEVARVTLRCLRRQAPAAVPSIVFLSGGQSHLVATTHLNAINKLDGQKPWKLSFSFGRALQDEARQAWRGQPGNLQVAPESVCSSGSVRQCGRSWKIQQNHGKRVGGIRHYRTKTNRMDLNANTVRRQFEVSSHYTSNVLSRDIREFARMVARRSPAWPSDLYLTASYI